MSNQESILGGYTGPKEPIPGYQLVERIGRGGYGDVWKVLAPGGVSKAVKLIYGDDSARMATELRALNRVKDVRHPFLLSIERIEQRGELLAIVTELGDKNLQQHFQACLAKGLPGIPPDELLAMMRDVADVLDYIYQEYSLQHLDIKPANLLLFGKRLKVADFGLVKNIYERSASLVHGLTPTYAAPEIFEGQPTRASDQYSLAALYQEMLTGCLPFDGATAARLATQHLRETPDLRPLPAAQQPIIARALSKDPQQRYSSCMELVDELTAAIRRSVPGPSATREEFPFVRELLLNSPQATSEPPHQSSADTKSHSPGPTQTHNAKDTDRPSVISSSPNESSPTIVIGIGGTAAKALQRLRLRIADRLGGVESLPAFKMLFVDLDNDTLNEINRDQRTWSELETVPTPLRNSAEYREQGHLHRRWLSRRWLFNVPRNLSTDGLRPLGRLALMSNANKVLRSLRSAILHVTSTQPGTPKQSPPRILIVASISGGTGSGMILDLAYAARHELQSAGIPDGIVEGVLLHSTPVGTGRDKALLNAVATLRELEHYSAPGNFYPGEPLFKIPPFHGNNRTFTTTQFLHLGEDLDSSNWLRAIEDVAEHLYCRLLTPLDRTLNGTRTSAPGTPTSLDVVQVRQIGGYAGSFVDDLTRQLCVEVIDGWCGSELQLDLTEQQSASAATLLINAMENSRTVKNQQLTIDTETQTQAVGIDVVQLKKRAGEMLQQELSTTQRDYLLAQIADAVKAVSNDKPDHEIAQFVITLQDRSIGLDFGERPHDNSRNTLFDLLHSRLASQAMQIASRFTVWVSDLIDKPGAGVDAAHHAAETARNKIRDLIAVLGKEIREVQSQQTNSRIALTTPPGPEAASNNARGWLLRRVDPRAAITEKLVQHGLSSFEELLSVLVQCQLRAIEANMSVAIDQLLSMWQELRQLGKRFDKEEFTTTQPDCGLPTTYEQFLRKLLSDNSPRLVQELRSRFEEEVLAGPKKLQRFVQQRGTYDQALGEPLRRIARQLVLQSMQHVLFTVLQHPSKSVDHAQLDIESTLGQILNEPMPIVGDEPVRAVMVVPAAAGDQSFRTQTSFESARISMIAAKTNNVTICRESRNAAIPDVIQAITNGQKSLVDVAASLYTRIDVDWDAPTNAIAQHDRAPAIWTEVAQTVPLA